MSFSISNDALIKLQYSLNRSNFNIQNSLLRLSTGFKINSARDDAASLSLASKLKSQMQGNLVAKQNTQKAQDYISMADSALGKMEEAAQDIRSKLVEAANGTYSSEERAIMQDEINQLAKNIRTVRNSTKYNDINVFGEAGMSNIYDIEKLTAEQAIEKGYTIISTAEDLKNISGSGKYILMNDIDLAGSNLGAKILSGTFDGNGYTISNLGITKDDGNVRGLFNKSTGTIKNVTLLDVNIDTATEYVGGLVGTVEGGSISNSVVTGNITSTKAFVGGMVGTIRDASIENATANVNISSSSGSGTGGLVGVLSYRANIMNSAATGNVSGYTNAGGLVGVTNGANTINDSYATGDVTVSHSGGAGFIASLKDGVTITNSYSTGDVKITRAQDGYIYGFSGSVSSGRVTIENCYSTGNLTAGANHAMGFAASGGSNFSVTNSFASGRISATGNQTKAFVSGNNANVTNSYVLESNGGTNSNPGVTEKSAAWFQDTSNLSFLGGEFSFSGNHPQILTNMEYVPKSPEVAIQIGANDGEDNRMNLDLSFTLPTTTFDISTSEKANESLAVVDNLLSAISLERTKAGYKSAMLDDIMESQTVKAHNYESSISTIMDTDYAKETANLLKNQILQQVTASLISQANISQSFALNLLNNNFLDFNNPNRKINLGMMINNNRL